jgi:acyl carrier protein
MQHKLLNILGVAVMAGMGLFVIAAASHDWLAKRRVRRLLASRASLDSTTFATTYFSDSPAKADVAAKLRDVLSSNLKQPLDGLRPDDRLDEDLHAELLANPHLFWDIEREFGVVTPTTDVEAYKQCLSQIRTFRDLVDYVASRTHRLPSGAAGAEQAAAGPAGRNGFSVE